MLKNQILNIHSTENPECENPKNPTYVIHGYNFQYGNGISFVAFVGVFMWFKCENHNYVVHGYNCSYGNVTSFVACGGIHL